MMFFKASVIIVVVGILAMASVSFCSLIQLQSKDLKRQLTPPQDPNVIAQYQQCQQLLEYYKYRAALLAFNEKREATEKRTADKMVQARQLTDYNYLWQQCQYELAYYISFARGET